MTSTAEPHDGIRNAIIAALAEMGVDDADIQLERPRDPDHGDVASNVAMTLARTLKRAPRQIAEELAEKIDRSAAGVTAVEVAGPGFLNFRLSSGAVAESLRDAVGNPLRYGASEEGQSRRVIVEWVSANPTGPLHAGHGRQAALGDAICRLLEWTGWKVHREFYYNDGGGQMDRLALSVRARYEELLGNASDFPEDGYLGEYVRDIAQQLIDAEGDRYAGDDSTETLDAMRVFAVRHLRAEQDADLRAMRIVFDEYFLESSLYEQGHVDQTIEALLKTGYVYEKDGALWLRTTDFGDDKDRVMVRSDEDRTPTYFLPDVAYHMTKWNRGFRHAINVQGSDHHGTVARVRAGLQALGLPEGYPEYVLHQMVRVERDGVEVKFSKRAGSYTTVRDLEDEVGVDVTRYFFQMRKPEAHLVFDLDEAADHSEKNPVYKIQYAHARMHAICRRAGIDPMTIDGTDVDLSVLDHELERELVKQLSDFPEVVRKSAELRTPHLLCDYLEQTSGAVNGWYHAGNPTRSPELAVLSEDESLRAARLVLVRAVMVVLNNGLQILGIDAPEKMERAPEEG